MSSRSSQSRGIAQLFPFLNWIGKWRDVSIIKDDSLAGITVALMLIPQAMAYAHIAGLPVQYGLYTALVPPVMAALFGSSHLLTTGPIALVSLITASTLTGLATPGTTEYISFAILLAAIVGILRLLLGLIRAGFIVNFFSHPVTVGFTNAAALIIILSQMQSVFGVAITYDDLFVPALMRAAYEAIRTPLWTTLIMAIGSFALLSFLRRIAPRSPYVLITVVTAILISLITGYSGETVGAIPRGLPTFSVPTLSWRAFPTLLSGALIITFLGMMEVISITHALAIKTRHSVNINQELIGQGLANILGSFFQCYPVSGSFSRSALNYESGARTGMSSVVASIVVALTLLFFTPLLGPLPKATLGAIIIFFLLRLIHFGPIRLFWKTHPYNGIVAITTFIVTLLAAPYLYIGILTGISLSFGFFIFFAMRPKISLLVRAPDGTFFDATEYHLPACEHIAVVRFNGQLFFGNCAFFENKILEIVASMPDMSCLIIDASGINRIDASGLHSLQTLIEELRDINVTLFLTRVNTHVMDAFFRSGMAHTVGLDHIFRRNHHAIDAAWRLFSCDHREKCPLYHYDATPSDLLNESE